MNDPRRPGVGGNPVADHLDLWTSALLVKSTAGRGSNGRLEAYGIKKLRGLILELAVCGKLVSQDPSDEPANVLLAKIEKEKIRLEKEGEYSGRKPLPEIAKEDEYFGLPNGWAWSRLGEVTNYGITDKAEPEDVAGDTWVLDLEDVEKETSRLLIKNRFAGKPFRSSKNRFKSGDVIYGKLRPYLDKVLVADEAGVCTTEMVPVRGYGGISPYFIRLVMKAPYFIKYADDSTHGMNLPRMGTDKACMALFPLAPVSEQHRIVAKVDELMALCDQLEQQQGRGIEAHQALVETLLGALTNVASAQEFAAAWSRIVAHFDTLFTTEHSIDRLKQAIIQIAVMGKLVLQDIHEESAQVFLKRIAKEKSRLLDAGVLKKEKPLPDHLSNNVPFEVPPGWQWASFEDIAVITSGLTLGKKYDSKKVVSLPYLRVANVQRGYLLLNEVKEIDVLESEVEKLTVVEGDLLITEGGDWDKVGRTAIWRNELPCVVHQNHVFKARRLLNEQNEVWLEMYLNSEVARTYFSGSSKQTTNLASINKTQLRACPVVLPPLAEQRRIIAKVEELMALCDALKARLAEAQATQIRLADAIVERAVAGPELSAA